MFAQIEPHEYSAIPGEVEPMELLQNYQSKLLHSLKIYLSKVSLTFKLNLSELELALNHIDPQKRFSPEIFTIYFRLRNTYGKQDIQPLFDTLQSLKNIQNFYALNRSYSTILSENWETLVIQNLREETFEHDQKKSVRMLPLIHWNQDQYPPNQLKEAENLIEWIDKDLWKEFETYVARVKLFSGKVIMGATSPRFFGALYLRIPFPDENPLLYYVEQLVHETSHLHLFTMMGEDNLTLNPENELFESPLREDKRPMNGIFHAAFVLARIVRIFKKLGKGKEVDDVIFRAEDHFFKAYETIEKYGMLTPTGRLIYNSLPLCFCT